MYNAGISLPGQPLLLHDRDSLLFLVHSLPTREDCWVISLFLSWVPLPHVTEQSSHSPHCPHEQLSKMWSLYDCLWNVFIHLRVHTMATIIIAGFCFLFIPCVFITIKQGLLSNCSVSFSGSTTTGYWTGSPLTPFILSEVHRWFVIWKTVNMTKIIFKMFICFPNPHHLWMLRMILSQHQCLIQLKSTYVLYQLLWKWQILGLLQESKTRMQQSPLHQSFCPYPTFGPIWHFQKLINPYHWTCLSYWTSLSEFSWVTVC